MPGFILSAETKATMMANLELELNARKEKLLSMCEAQCASLRSRLERRINRVPNNKRNIKLIDVIEPAAVQKPAPAKKEKEMPAVPVHAPAPAARRGRPAATTTATTTTVTTATARAAAARKVTTTTTITKTTRGIKRTSDEIEDKENNAELTVPKKRTKAAPAPRTTRATRAASNKKVDPAPQILSPKNNNARPAPRTRTQRAR